MKKLVIIALLLFSLQAFTQDDYQGPENTRVEMADQLRSSGKIYVVVAVLVTVMAGVVIYTIILDRRVSRLERESGIK